MPLQPRAGSRNTGEVKRKKGTVIKTKAVTIKEIADIAQVSTATVSRVINGYKWIKPEVRQRVEAVMEEMHYTPNYNASMMVTGKSNMIVIIVATIKNPFFSEFTSTAISELKRVGYFAMVFETDNVAEEEISFLNSPIARLVDGIISVTDCIENEVLAETIRSIQTLNKPILFVDRDLPPTIADSVINDNISGIGTIVDRMVKAGHERIAMIVGQQGISVVQDKIKGYTLALEHAGISVDPDYIRRASWSIEAGYTQTKALLAADTPPTAIIAGNNMICNGMLDALDELGLKPGTDISVAGTEECENDTRLFSKLNISTLKLDSVALAKFASKHIIDRLTSSEEENDLFIKTMFSMKFIDRGSIGRPKGK